MYRAGRVEAYIEASPLIFIPNQLTGFFWTGTMAVNVLRNRLQILFRILSKFKGINWPLSPLKLSERSRFSHDFRGDKS